MKMQESVLKRVYKMEEKNNIHYATKNGKAYSYSRVLYFLFTVWASFFAAVVAVGYLMNRTAFKVGDAAYGQYTKWIFICFCLVFFLIAGAVLNGFKRFVPTFAVTLAAGVYGCIFFATVINSDPGGLFGLPFKYYWAHFIPLAAVIICSLIMFIIGVRQWAILRKEYRDVSERLYEEYLKTADEMSEEQWQEFLNNYTPVKNKKQTKKQTEEE